MYEYDTTMITTLNNAFFSRTNKPFENNLGLNVCHPVADWETVR